MSKPNARSRARWRGAASAPDPSAGADPRRSAHAPPPSHRGFEMAHHYPGDSNGRSPAATPPGPAPGWQTKPPRHPTLDSAIRARRPVAGTGQNILPSAVAPAPPLQLRRTGTPAFELLHELNDPRRPRWGSLLLSIPTARDRAGSGSGRCQGEADRDVERALVGAARGALRGVQLGEGRGVRAGEKLGT